MAEIWNNGDVPSRLLVPAAAAVVLTGLTACGGDEPGAGGLPSDLPSPQVQTSATSVASGVASDAAQQTIALTVSGGKVTGQSGQQNVALGSRVRITVTSDVADEMHVHGYDLNQEVAPGSPASIEFVTDEAGSVEVELHRTNLALTRLQIS